MRQSVKSLILMIATTATFLLFAAWPCAANAASRNVLWVDWTSNPVPPQTPATGTVQGTIGPLAIGVTYTGQIKFAQTSTGGSWSGPSPYSANPWMPADTFTSATVGNAPTNEIITLVGGTTTANTITFSSPVTNPVMAIYSLGAPDKQATYQFNQTPTILSDGTGQYTNECGDSLSVSENTLSGWGGYGVIQFTGTFTSISWTAPTYENYHGFTVGLPYIPVGIDVKPGSYPNCFNINGNGVVPVAILGSASFDVAEVNPLSLSFGGLSVGVRGNKGPQCSVQDVSGDFTTQQGAPDGYPDLVCQFVDTDTFNWNEGGGTAQLTGNLIDGTPIIGIDTICITPP